MDSYMSVVSKYTATLPHPTTLPLLPSTSIKHRYIEFINKWMCAHVRVHRHWKEKERKIEKHRKKSRWKWIDSFLQAPKNQRCLNVRTCLTFSPTIRPNVQFTEANAFEFYLIFFHSLALSQSLLSLAEFFYDRPVWYCEMFMHTKNMFDGSISSARTNINANACGRKFGGKNVELCQHQLN